MCYTILYVNVKSNICSEMSCLLKQWLIIKCIRRRFTLTPMCRHVCNLIKYILIISSSSSIICRLSHSSFVSLPFKKVMRRGGQCLFERGVAQGVGAYLGEGAYQSVGALFEEILYVLVLVWYTSPSLFLLISAYFSSLKNICKKHLDIKCFLLLFRNKNKPVFVLQNQQSETFIKFNKNNNGIIDLY